MFAMFCIWVKNKIITAQDKKRKEMEEDDGYRHEFREYREHQRRNLK